MSKEEILKRVEDYISENKWNVQGGYEVNAIQGLLDLYNKEKEKNKTLEDLLQGNLFEMYKYYKDLCSSYQANSISKDKIKAKIEEVENNKKYLSKFNDWKEKDYTNEDITNYCIEICEELLEKKE